MTSFTEVTEVAIERAKKENGLLFTSRLVSLLCYVEDSGSGLGAFRRCTMLRHFPDFVTDGNSKWG